MDLLSFAGIYLTALVQTVPVNKSQEQANGLT